MEPARLSDWVNLNFPLGMPEEEIVKAAQAARKSPVPGSVFDGLSAAQFAVAISSATAVRKAYELKISFENPEALVTVERYTILSAIDRSGRSISTDGQPALQHRPAGLRPARSADRVQGGGVQDLRRA
jgi:hypothetical protein